MGSGSGGGTHQGTPSKRRKLKEENELQGAGGNILPWLLLNGGNLAMCADPSKGHSS